jgi:hypothetical protein
MREDDVLAVINDEMINAHRPRRPPLAGRRRWSFPRQWVYKI